MKTITKGLSLAALALTLTGAAYAAQVERGWNGPEANTSVTRTEAQTKAEAMFARLDVNKDGKLDAADQAGRLAAKFDAIDTDHNSSISREEFAVHHARHEDMKGLGDGIGGKDRSGMRGMHRGDHEGMMMRMSDTNKDGAIAREEFVATGLKRFDMLDTDHNGTVTPAERKAGMARMRQMMGAMHHRSGQDGMAMPPPALAN